MIRIASLELPIRRRYHMAYQLLVSGVDDKKYSRAAQRRK